jgi:hypothetical protein
MSYVLRGTGGLDYAPCRYGASRLVFRGPSRRTDRPYVAALGGTETYGRFVERPWPVLVEAATGLRMLNLGCVNAGLDVHLNDPEILRIAGGGQATVVQVTGAQNLTNRFYAVHPRRNDRFLRATPALRGLYPDVDFTEVHFTRHLVATLAARDAGRFAEVLDDLRATWIARMRALLSACARPRVLLWLAPPEAGGDGPLGPEPLFVTAAMVAEVAPEAEATVRVTPSAGARALGTAGMVFAPADGPAAAETPGVAVHGEIAHAVASVLSRLLVAAA